MYPMAQVFEAGDYIGENFNARLFLFRSSSQFLDDPVRHHSGFHVPVEKLTHCCIPYDQDFCYDWNAERVDIFKEFLKRL